MPFPEYFEYYSSPSPSGFTTQMTRNNNIAKIIALIGDGSDIFIQESTKIYFGDFGPKEIKSSNIFLSNTEMNSLLNIMEASYQKELSKRLQNIKYEAPHFDIEKYFSPGGGGDTQFRHDMNTANKKYLEQINQVYIEMGKSPKSIIFDYVRKNMKLGKIIENKTNLPTIQSAD